MIAFLPFSTCPSVYSIVNGTRYILNLTYTIYSYMAVLKIILFRGTSVFRECCLCHQTRLKTVATVQENPYRHPHGRGCANIK